MNVIDPVDLRLEHITVRKNKDGSERYYFRRRGQPIERLPDNPRSEEFMAMYRRCLEWVAPSVYADEGSFAWLCDQYMDSTDFKSKADATKTSRRRIILSMMQEPLQPGKSPNFGQERARKISRAHIEILRDRKSDNPNAANERLKILSRVFKMAVSKGWIDVNHVRDVERLRTPKGGHETATDAEVAKYLETHVNGSPWLAMMLLKNTGVRISDLRLLGRQHLQDGLLVFRTAKTGVKCELPISTELAAALPMDNMTFLLTESGKPFASDKAMSQRVAKWFRQAGVKKITAHGVRKWLATRMAEQGLSEYELCAWFGWNDPKEARPYVRAASRRKLAHAAGTKMENALHNAIENAGN